MQKVHASLYFVRIMQNYITIFQKTILSLNEAQRQAVETLEGPVMVVAGPGTGKTQILAARIGNILLNTDTPPYSILCLTYTDSGAIAMRRRLSEFIGPAAHRVHIHTFHGFCNMVIQENRHLFGNWDLQPVSDLEKVQFFKEHIDKFDKDHPLKRFAADAYFEKGRMASLFDMMKKEDWSPEMLCQKADSYIADLSNRDEYVYKKANAAKGIKVGDIKQAAIDKEVEKMTLLKAAANEYPRFETRMRNNNRYDFNDMILWVLKAFDQHPDLLLRYQEQFLYMLVDEYQDTSGAQNELLFKLASYWDEPNLFVVGDDDQSIYKFQGANIENILRFREKYPSTLVIALTENYRSTQPVLNAAQGLIGNNMERLVGFIDGFSKDLTSANPSLMELTEKPQVLAFPNDVQEAAFIAGRIMEAKLHGEKLDEIAVVYRSHKQAENLIKFLQLKQIPVNARRKVNVLKEPLIMQLITVLNYLAFETRLPNSGEHFLFEIFHYHLYNISPLSVAKLSADIYRANTEKRGKSVTWREHIQARAHAHVPSLFPEPGADTAIEDIKKIADRLEDSIKEVQNLTLPSLVEYVINHCGFLAFAMQAPDRMWQMQLLSTFFDYVQSESQRHVKINLQQLTDTLDTMMAEGIELSINKVQSDANGVHFISAHAAKGLEYDTVYLMGCNADRWEKSRNPNNSYKLPDTLIMQSGDDTEEDRRLFYVAMTRAKRHLCISYHAARDNKETEESRFVTEVRQALDLDKSVYTHADQELVLEYQYQVLRLADEVQMLLPEKDYIDSLLEKFQMSPTSLSAYLKCPVGFYYTQLIRVPSAINEYAAFGNAVHATLDWLFREMRNRNNVFPDKQEMLSNFRFQMRRLEADFTEEQYKRRLEYGEKILPPYYDLNIHTWNKTAVTEHNLRNIELNGIPLKGKLDKIEFEGNTAIVVDYKTGKYDNAKKKLVRPSPAPNPDKFEEVHGGDYWRQAVFYKILIDNYPQKSWKVQSARFDFVEPESKSGAYFNEPVYITAEDERMVKAQIHTAWQQIQNHEFSKGCNKKDCEWCNFVKSFPEEFSKKPVGTEVEQEREDF